jgi:hypothetical protein
MTDALETATEAIMRRDHRADIARVNLIIKTLVNSGEGATEANIRRQFVYETGREMPRVRGSRHESAVQSSSEAAAAGAPSARVGGEDRHGA